MSTNVGSIQETSSSARRAAGRLIWVAPLAMAAATVANIILYSVVGLVSPEAAGWTGMGMAQIAISNVVYLLLAAVVAAIIARFSAQPARHFGVVATVSLLLSMAMPVSAGLGFGPPGAPPAPAATVVLLCAMHVVSYAVSVPLFTRLAFK